EWVHVQLHQQKGMISLSPSTICNSALLRMRKTLFLPRSPRNVDFRMRNPAKCPPKALKVRDVFWRILVAKIRLSWFVRFDTRTPHFSPFGAAP
ncbi:hypothetical protein MZF27_24745, partial [Escherichia coli]|nr:hypothetical protein [Escherichia coli]